MAFSDLCHISNAYKTIENDTDQSERIMEENSIVRELIAKILDDSGPDTCSSIPPPDKPLNGINGVQSHYTKNDTYIPPYPYQNPNFYQNDNYNYNMNGFNGYNYQDNDVNSLLGLDLTTDTTETVSQEQLNLLRLAAQEIGGAQFQSPKFDYNFFEPNQRNSLPENVYPPNNYNRPNSLNLDINYNNYDNHYNGQRYPNNYKDNQETEILSYLNQMNITHDRNQEMDFKMPIENGHYPNEDYKMQEERNKMFYRNYPQKNFDNPYFEMMGQMDRSPINQMNFDYSNQNFKQYPNEFMQRRDMQMMRDFPNEQRNFENRENMQQMAIMRQNQELARQMSLLMRNRPPPNQLNVDVSFLHENNPYNLGLGALLGPPSGPPPVLQSPMLDLPLLAPFYTMRNMRTPVSSSAILHARLDSCYEQWRQLERERKRTEARLALAYPGRAVSSCNSIPVPRLPVCPSRVDRLTVDMLREHTKVLTLMGKMETLRASVCITKRNKEENKITVLKRGQENVGNEQKEAVDPAILDPTSWRDDVRNLADIAPHKEVENAMLSWRNAVTAVQTARKREIHTNQRNTQQDPILQLAEAVKTLCECARRARAAMWSDLTLTVALAPIPTAQNEPNHSTPTKQTQETDAKNFKTQSNANEAKTKEEKPTTDQCKTEPTTNGTNITKNNTAKDKDKNHQQRRTQNYKKPNQRNDFYRNQRYDSRFMNRHPYHYLATGPIN